MICTEHVLEFCLVRGYIKTLLFLALPMLNFISHYVL